MSKRTSSMAWVVAIFSILYFSSLSAAKEPYSCIKDENSIRVEEFSAGITYIKVTCPDGTKLLIQKKFNENATPSFVPDPLPNKSQDINASGEDLTPKEIFPDITVSLSPETQQSLNKNVVKKEHREKQDSDVLKEPVEEITVTLPKPSPFDVQDPLLEDFGKKNK